MSKVICDICGTAYPESAAQCPICGSAKQIDSKTISDSASDGAERPAKGPTRGGHFSNANVRKRNKANQAAKRKSGAPHNEKQGQNDDNKRGMVIVAWVLLIAVILVLAYIVVQFILPMFGSGQSDTTTGPKADGTTAVDTVVNATPVDTGVPCTNLVVSGGDISLDAVGRAWLLEVTAEPADTTDLITYTSADERVATVSTNGRVTAVGPGQTVITITCGNVTKQCNVACTFGEETTVPETTVPETTVAPTTQAPTETTPPETTEVTDPPMEENFGLFQQDDVTLALKGETFYFESGDVGLSDIIWSSDDPSVATVENGLVTGVGSGKTVIRGEHNGQTDSCIIRCSFDDGSTDSGSGGSDSEDHPEWPHLYPAEDVSIGLDDSFELSYVNEDGELPDISWSSDDGGIAYVDGDTVVGVGYGTTTIRGSYGDKEITCVVRVREDY